MRGANASRWRDDARYWIAAAHAILPAEATLKQRRAALRQRAYYAHGGTSWGKKMWGQECRRYLEQHGQKPRQLRDQLTLAPDIIFPFARGNEG